MKTLGQYAKGVAGGAGAAVIALQPEFGGRWWFAIVLAVEAFLGVVFMTNTTPTPPPPVG